MRAITVLGFSLVCAGAASAQTRITLPAGSVVMVQTDQALESATAAVGQTFETTVTENVSVNGYTVIPANSKIRGVVSYVQPATRERSGVMQIAFNRLTFPNGRSAAISGRLTSTDSTERRQIESRADPRVVLVGGRGGLGAAIAGAGSRNSAASGIISALSGMLSEGRDVNVPAGTRLAVQLENAIVLTGLGESNASETIYTSAERIRAAQQELARRSYYRGVPNGQINNATRSAIFEFQLDNNLTPTGNLDGRTAAALGISVNDAAATNNGALSARESQILRRAAQTLAARHRQDLGIAATGAIANNDVNEADLELLFAFSAFADNASLYEQLVRNTTNQTGAVAAGRVLINSARRVDAALRAARSSNQVQNVWASIRRQLQELDTNYR